MPIHFYRASGDPGVGCHSPREVTGFVGGIVFGPLWGIIFSTVGLALGSWLAFNLGTWLADRLSISFVRQETINVLTM